MTRQSPDTEPRERRRCVNTTKAGRPCRMPPLTSSTPPRCWNHSRDNADLRAQSKSRGGRRTKVARRTQSLHALIEAMSGTESEDAPYFKLLPEDEVGRDQAVCSLEPGTFKVVRPEDLNHDAFECTAHVDCLKLKAMMLVGLRPWKNNYTLGERHVPAALVEAWLDEVEKLLTTG